MTRIRVVLAWVILLGSMTGSALSFAHVIGRGEPQLVLQLSWFALIFESFNAVQISHDRRERK